MHRNPSSSRSFRIGAAAALLLAASGCRTQEEEPSAEPERAPAKDAAAPAEGSVQFVYPAAPGAFVDIAERVERGVVTVRSTRKVVGGPGEDFEGIDDPNALGTGFLIDTDGYILTNDHIIANAPEVRVVLYDGAERRATVAGRDPKLNVALLKIDGSPRLVPLVLGSSEETRVGEWIVAVGNAFGVGPSLSAGIISAKGNVPMGPKNEYHRTYLQTDATINSGNSGGPVVNMQGDVVGIAVAVKGRGAAVGYAIPIDLAKRVLPNLKTDGVVNRAWLGVKVAHVDAELAQRLHLERATGAFVTEVITGSPAKKAGIRTKDVILEFDERGVDEKSLAWLSASSGIGRTVPISVWRDGAKLELQIITEKLPE